MSVVGLWLVLWACGQSPGGDRDAYLRSIRSLGSDAGVAAGACKEIAAPVLQGECLLFVAQARARGGDAEGSRDTCEGIEHPGWQEVCFFEIVDGLGSWGDDAIRACARSGRFSDRCLSHALQRHAGRVVHRFGVGEEADLLAWIQAQKAHYGIVDDTRVERDIAAQHLAWRSCRASIPEGPCPPFDRAMCGEAPEDTCLQTYKVYVKSEAQGSDGVRELCRRPISRIRVEAAGLPAWTPDTETLATQVWAQLCRAAMGRPH